MTELLILAIKLAVQLMLILWWACQLVDRVRSAHGGTASSRTTRARKIGSSDASGSTPVSARNRRRSHRTWTTLIPAA